MQFFDKDLFFGKSKNDSVAINYQSSIWLSLLDLSTRWLGLLVMSQMLECGDSVCALAYYIDEPVGDGWIASAGKMLKGGECVGRHDADRAD